MEPRLKVLFERPIEPATSSRERDLSCAVCLIPISAGAQRWQNTESI